MANSASDARHSEADIRQTLIENNLNLCHGQLAVEYVLHGDIAGDPVVLRQIARDWVTGDTLTPALSQRERERRARIR